MFNYHRSNLNKGMCDVISNHVASFNLIPGLVVLYDVRDWSIVYMSETGLKQLKTTFEEIRTLSREEYHCKYFNIEDAMCYVPKIEAFIKNSCDDASVSFYQQLKFPDSQNWNWHLSSVKIFMRDETGKPVIAIIVSIPVDSLHYMAAKAGRLLEENNFLRNNYNNFCKLSKRELTILREIALGKSSIQIADKLFISSTTVDTHRRNIREKLNAKSSFEISQYARVFNLI